MRWCCWMADGIFFNYWGITHELELCLFDRPTVWRAVVDGGLPCEVTVFFDAPTDSDVIDLIDLAIGAWVADGE
jgi:hypothetical protein